MPYIQESREKVRAHIGKLMFGTKYLKDVVSAVGAGSVTLSKAARFAQDHFAGGVLYVINGAAAGVDSYVNSSATGTGVVTLLPVPILMPSPGDKVEIWPGEMSPEDVNDAIDMAILDVQHLAGQITVVTSPTIDSDRVRVAIPANLNMVARVTFEYGGIKYKLRPRDPRDPNPWDQEMPFTFDIEGSNLVVWGSIPSSATNVRLVGYAQPALPTADTDLINIRSDFVVYKAASILVQRNIATDLLDPEGSGQRATFWAQQAEQKKREMNGQVLANTTRVEEYI